MFVVLFVSCIVHNVPIHRECRSRFTWKWIYRVFLRLITSKCYRLLLTDAGRDRHVDVLFDMRRVRKCINSTVVNLEIVVESNVR